MRGMTINICLYVALLVVIFAIPAIAEDHPSNKDEPLKSTHAESHFGVYGGMGFPESLTDVKGRGDLNGATFSDLKFKEGPMMGINRQQPNRPFTLGRSN